MNDIAFPPVGTPDQERLAAELAFAISTLPERQWDAALARGLQAYGELFETKYCEHLTPLQAARSTLHLHLALLKCLRAHVVAAGSDTCHA